MKLHWKLYLATALLALIAIILFAFKYQPGMLFYVFMAIFLFGLIEPVLIENSRLKTNKKILSELGATQIEALENYQYAKFNYKNKEFNVSSKVSRWSHSLMMHRALIFTMKSKNKCYKKISNVKNLDFKLNDIVLEKKIQKSKISELKGWVIELDIFHSVLYTMDTDVKNIKKCLDLLIEISK